MLHLPISLEGGRECSETTRKMKSVSSCTYKSSYNNLKELVDTRFIA